MKQKYSIETKLINARKQATRCIIKFKKKELLNFDFYNDKSGNLQIILNTYNSKIKSHNKLPDKWARYIPKNNFLVKDSEFSGLNHITFHPKNHRKNDYSKDRRLTRINFGKDSFGKYIIEEVFAKSKEDKLVVLINFFREIKNGTRLETISIIQKHNKSDRLENYEKLLKDESEDESEKLKTENFSGTTFFEKFRDNFFDELEGNKNTQREREVFSELGYSKDWISCYFINYFQNKPKGETHYFEFDQNYVLRISETDDIEIIKERKNFFSSLNLKELDLILIGNLDIVKESGKCILGFHSE